MSLARPCQSPMPHAPSTAVAGTDGNILRDLTVSDIPGPVRSATATQDRFPHDQQPGVSWYIRRLLYGHIASGGVLVDSCARGCSFCKCRSLSDITPCIKVQSVSSLSGEVVSEEYDWYFRLAGDIVSKANSSA